MTLTNHFSTSCPNRCPECNGGIYFIEQRGENVCSECGLVIQERMIDPTSIKRAFTQEEIKKKRTTDISNKIIPIELMTKVNHRSTLTKSQDTKRALGRDKYTTAEVRHFYTAIVEVKRLCSLLNIPKYCEHNILRLYKKLMVFQIARGRSINGIVSGCLYYIIKKDGLPYSLEDVIKVSKASSKVVKRSFRLVFNLCEKENIKVGNEDVSKKIKTFNHNHKSLLLIPKFLSELKLDNQNEIESLCIKVLKAYFKKAFVGGLDPKGLCAGVIYLVCKYKQIGLTQKYISKICNITEVTLRTRYKDIRKKVQFKR